ncbi:uncharacterized protein LOC133794938 [Humulus lupulus]|uniref:uncharacterized protein LOC133794938 n=1 Tax=Humulus lupulus TaxID=3486 RepID=UPI002B402782|nr:uncharacterized protein LOC133794938 [Humulus lupulus]
MNLAKKTRGKTLLANLTKRNNDLRIINWNEKGQPVGTNSVQFSSFVGALVREVVPYTISDWRKVSPIMRDVLWASIQAQYDLHDDWQKKMCFEMMAELWRAGKYRLAAGWGVDALGWLECWASICIWAFVEWLR